VESTPVIVLDTHTWVSWVHGEEQLTGIQAETIAVHERDTIGVSAISCWEVAKLVARGRLELPCPLEEWFELALSYPGVSLLDLTPEIAIASTRLPGQFHRDPADQIIVATARVYGCQLVTSDSQTLKHPYVETIS
jgi:PIN domain nuclease of toxin-antitoxin system